MKKACRESRELLADYIEGTLSERERERLRKHIEECSDCQTLLDAYRKGEEAWRKLEHPEPDEGYWPQLTDKIMSRVGGAQPAVRPAQAGRGWRESLRAWSSPPLAWGTVAAVVVVAVIGLYAYREGELSRVKEIASPELQRGAVADQERDLGLDARRRPEAEEFEADKDPFAQPMPVGPAAREGKLEGGVDSERRTDEAAPALSLLEEKVKSVSEGVAGEGSAPESFEDEEPPAPADRLSEGIDSGVSEPDAERERLMAAVRGGRENEALVDIRRVPEDSAAPGTLVPRVVEGETGAPAASDAPVEEADAPSQQAALKRSYFKSGDEGTESRAPSSGDDVKKAALSAEEPAGVDKDDAPLDSNARIAVEDLMQKDTLTLEEASLLELGLLSELRADPANLVAAFELARLYRDLWLSRRLETYRDGYRLMKAEAERLAYPGELPARLELESDSE